MNRRAFLAAVGTTVTIVGSGCVGDTSISNGSDSTGRITTRTNVRIADSTDERTDGTTETNNGPDPIRTPTPGDISLSVDRLGEGSQPEAKLENESDATLDMTGSTVRFDTGQQHEISDLRLVPGAELDVVTAREGCSERVATSYPPIYTRCARFAEPVSTQSGTVTVTNPDGETVAETNY